MVVHIGHVRKSKVAMLAMERKSQILFGPSIVSLPLLVRLEAAIRLEGYTETARE